MCATMFSLCVVFVSTKVPAEDLLLIMMVLQGVPKNVVCQLIINTYSFN